MLAIKCRVWVVGVWVLGDNHTAVGARREHGEVVGVHEGERVVQHERGARSVPAEDVDARSPGGRVRVGHREIVRSLAEPDAMNARFSELLDFKLKRV